VPRRVHLRGDHVWDDPNGETVVLSAEEYDQLVTKIERQADQLQVEVIYRQLAERRLMELEGNREDHAGPGPRGPR
jgi:hypothetical protein